MKLALRVLSLICLLVGAELALGVFSHAGARLDRGFSALRAAPGTGRVPGAFLGGLVLMVLAVSSMAFLEWLGRREDNLSRGKICPRCGKVTRRVPRGVQHKVLAGLLSGKVTRRRCKECGWVGLAVRRS